MDMDYTVHVDKSYEETIEAVIDSAGTHGFRVQAVHDVAATLAEKGFEREPVTIIEVCNAKHASRVLAEDVKIGLMLPCPVMVYEQEGEVFIATMRPSLIAGFFPHADIEAVAGEVEDYLLAIIDDAAAV